ncbi:zinc finger, C4 type [Dictyocaulus viviparus]|uniref:Zinc finger, C4 type n=1 Tax=Dictyocaulus viviparus TaxID=29172 RepID=A0A0D8Y5Y9_DICVI|nr:zinc finger, C4 type [Dictyocaulus viviparus]
MVDADACRVCGDGNAKTHYGVVTCFGCKGFFRRTLKRPSEYQCRHNGTCIVDRHERNSCRYCRFKKCIEVGMDPKAVRPDRDATGRHYQSRQRRSKLNADDESEVDAEWIRKLPVDMRTTLMQIMNIDLMVGSGDSSIDGTTLYPLNFFSIRQLLEDPSVLDGKRTEMRYDSFREVEVGELPAIAHRNLLSSIDWVDHLFDIMDIQNLDDKVLTVKHCFAPLMVFNFSVITAKNTKQSDIVCVCNFGYVKRDVSLRWNEPYHFANRLAEKAIDELVDPFRRMNIKDEEAALLKAILIANPYIKGLTAEAGEAIADMRDRIQEALYHVVREMHPKEVASSRFGNLLLFIPSVIMLGTLAHENLQIIDSFSHMQDRLMHDVLQEYTTEDSIMKEGGIQSQHHLTETSMLHSASSTSIESLSSCGCSYPYGTGEHSLPYNFSSNSLPSTLNNFEVVINSASSMPNLDQMPECDPDYNVTLTPDMYCDMRQAMSLNQNMDTSLETKQLHQNTGSVPNSPTAESQPSFYIESSRHTFTVTTNVDNRFPTYQGVPCQNNRTATISAPDQSVHHPQQQQLCKSNSFPSQYYDCDQYSNQQSMDFDDGYY